MLPAGNLTGKVRDLIAGQPVEIIRRFSEAGLSQRVIADVLGVSHQRVHQLANAS